MWPPCASVNPLLESNLVKVVTPLRVNYSDCLHAEKKHRHPALFPVLTAHPVAHEVVVELLLVELAQILEIDFHGGNYADTNSQWEDCVIWSGNGQAKSSSGFGEVLLRVMTQTLGMTSSGGRSGN